MEINASLLLILEKLISDNESIAIKTKEYFVNNHDISKVSASLLSRLSSSELSYKDLKESGCTKPGFLYMLKKLTNLRSLK